MALQRSRVENAIKAAEKLPEGMLVEQHGREIDRYALLVDRVVRLQMDMGVISRVPKKIQGAIARDPDDPLVS